MAATRKPAAPRPDPVTYDLSAVPMLNQTCERLREDLGRFLDYMEQANRRPAHLHLRPHQLNTLKRGVNAKIDKNAPPCGGLMFRGIPVVPTVQGGQADAS